MKKKHYETDENAAFDRNFIYEWVEVLTGNRSHIITGWTYFKDPLSPNCFEKKQKINRGILYLVNFVSRFVYGCDTYEKAMRIRKKIFNDTGLNRILNGNETKLYLPSLGQNIVLTDTETILWMIYNQKDIDEDVLDIYSHLIGKHTNSEKKYRNQYSKIKRLINMRTKM